jgi:hypothetical protein
MFDHHVNPPPLRPEIERMQQRSQNYRRLVEQRFRETARPGRSEVWAELDLQVCTKGCRSGDKGFTTGTKGLPWFSSIKGLRLCDTTIDKQFRSGNVATVVSREKYRDLSDLTGCTEPAHLTLQRTHSR